jgi:hypothetical protein
MALLGSAPREVWVLRSPEDPEPVLGKGSLKAQRA